MTEEDSRKLPAIVIVGIGGGGSRIVSEGLDKIERFQHLDRYSCLYKTLRARSEDPHIFIVDTSSDPTTPGFFTNIPKDQKISLSSSIKGMSRGAGGKPGRAAKAVLNEEVSRTLAQKLYKPITDLNPAIVVLVHTADGGTGGGLSPEILQQLAFVMPSSTIFWVFTVLPTRSALSLSGPRTVAVNIGKMMKVIRRISDNNYHEIPFECREAIREIAPGRQEDLSYEFNHSRVAMFPLSNDHFAQCHSGHGRKEIREEVLNPFPIELLSQALYPFLKYVVATEEEQQWMQKHWPLGPIDIPDIMAGVSPGRPMVMPHLWIDPGGWETGEMDKVIMDLKEGKIDLQKEEGKVEDGVPENFVFTGAPVALHEFRASSIYCIPIVPEGSEYFDEFGELVSDHWFPALSGQLNYIGGRKGTKIGVISHSANLKPQPIPAMTDKKLGFEKGLLVSLIFGAIPADLPIWLEASQAILDDHKTAEQWELSFYDANDCLNEVAYYCGLKK